MNRFDILNACHAALERGMESHGEAETSFSAIGNLWNAYLKNRPDPTAPLQDYEVSEMLTLFKVARNQTRLNVDNAIDGAGYLALAGELQGKVTRCKRDDCNLDIRYDGTAFCECCDDG